MNRSFRLFYPGKWKLCFIIGLVCIVFPLIIMIVANAGKLMFLVLLGILIELPLLLSLNNKLEVSDRGLTLIRLFGKCTITWEEITSVRLVRFRVSFTRRHLVSAIISDAKGRYIFIHGVVADYDEIINILKARVPDVFTRALQISKNPNWTLETTNNGLVLRFRDDLILRMSWDEIKNVKLIKARISFTRPKRYPISAIVSDVKGRRICISGKAHDSEEVINAIKARVPYTITG